MNERRQHYRDYMQKLDGTAARKALAEGLYVDGPKPTVADRIVIKAELGLVSLQAVIGSIGSGKTTQLHRAFYQLNAREAGSAYYLESLVQEEEDATGGGLLSLSVDHELEKAEADADKSEIKPDDVRDRYRKSLLMKPGERLSQKVISGWDDTARDIYQMGWRTILFDSLDRVTKLDALGEVIDHEVPRYRKAGLTVVMVLPQRLMYGPERVLLEGFDEVYHLGPIDLEHGDEGRDFLRRVLRARADVAILPDESQDLLVSASGGVLRDLVSLARSAGDLAYGNGTGPIEPPHVEAAIDGFGRKKLINLSLQQIDTLQKVRTRGSFVQVNDQDLTLLLTGCILEYQKPNGAPRYAVHPTIEPLLAQIAGDP